MISPPRSLIAALAATATLAAGAPAASASTALPGQFSFPAAFARFQARPLSAASFVAGPSVNTAGPCGAATGPHGQGAVGGTSNQVCMGAGLSFIGPSIGQIATVIGPTIISPGFVGNVIVSAGNGSIGP
jgi:hypothetical protein